MARQQRAGWNTIRLAEAAGISQITMSYNAAVVDPMRVGATLPNLEHAGFFSDRTRLPRQLDLGLLTPGWREFGMIGNQRDRELDLGQYRAGVTAWVLAFEWHPSRCAWDALLEAQETIRPQRLSLTPDLLLPCMFLTRMAHFPLTVEERGPAAQDHLRRPGTHAPHSSAGRTVHPLARWRESGSQALSCSQWGRPSHPPGR